ncbi:hemicentin-1-like [Diadema setosum]|uniref:hemicentin-1-like n=1 Tax=Diadema setosum TaxID=31175 RepID=UPI003B3A4B5C
MPINANRQNFQPALRLSLPVLLTLFLVPCVSPQGYVRTSLTIDNAHETSEFESVSSTSSYVYAEPNPGNQAGGDVEGQRTVELEGGQGGATMAFVFDVTGSMFDDLQQVIEGAKRILDSNLMRRDTPLKNFALVPFHDPDIQEITLTEDPEVFQEELKKLYVQGGGDCPEKSITAIYHALNISLPGSSIYVFTDARSKDYEITNEVLKLIQEKESQVVFVMTGDCGNQSHPGFQAYEQIAATSSGQVFMLNKSDVDLVLKFVEVTLESRKVNLLSTDYQYGIIQVHQLPIDSRVRQITISISGDSRRVLLRDPNGRDIPLMYSERHQEGRKYLEELLTLENVYVVGMVEPTPGIYQLITESQGEHAVRVTAISLLDFAFGFARYPTVDLNNTFHRPIKGVESALMIEALHMNPPGTMQKVEFLNMQGETIKEAWLTRSEVNPDLFIARNIIPPNEYFHIRVSGIDSHNFRFQRLTKAAISPLIPDPPRPHMPRRTRGYFGTTAVLTCRVESLIPFTIQWMKRGVPLTDPIPFSESGSATWNIEDADSRVEGVYTCLAENEEGRERSETYLDITEPPPTIAKPSNISVLPGSNAMLTCVISSTVEYNISWDKPNSGVSLQTHSRVSLKSNGSLVIRNVRPEDAGRYRCMAENEGGTSLDYIHVFVQERPQISMEQGNVTYMIGQNVTLRCSAIGHPQPELRWLKGGVELPVEPGLSPGEVVYQINNADRNSEGVYSCVARNTAGTDWLHIYVIYQEPPRISMVTYRYLTPPSQTATMSCPASGVPPPEIMWFKGDRDLSQEPYARIHANGDLDIMGVKDSDAGQYTCVAVNPAGTYSETVTLEVGSSPTILYPPIDLGVDYGMNVSVTCIAMGHPPPQVTWRKVGHTRLDLNPRVRMTEDGNLFIQDLQVEDSGTYVCVAQNIHGSVEASSQLRITNLIQPQISATNPEQSVIVGEDVVIRCTVLAGNPPPSITWYHHSEELFPEFMPRLRLLPDGSLEIRDAFVADAGSYSCVAVNVVGNDTRTTTLKVYEPPSISTTETSYTVVRHESVTLLCPADGYPPPTIEWVKNGQTIPNQGLHQSTLILNYVTQEDAGTYICRVQNDAGTAELEISLFVLVPPTHPGVYTPGVVNVTQGESVTLPCEMTGNPPPTITWYKDSELLPAVGLNHYQTSEGALVIQQMSLEDEAQYTCVASNVAGNNTKDMRIIILIPPTIEPGSTDYTAVAGDSIVLSCEAFGIPAPQVAWQKDGALLGSGNDNVRVLETGSLEIFVTSEDHTGTYTCIVSNEAGSENRIITLEIHVPPVIIDTQTQYTVVEGRSVTLFCPSSGTPPPTISWSKGGTPIPANDPHYDIDDVAGTLTIVGVLPTDYGAYECLVSNAGGTVSKDITVSVYVPPRLPSNLEVEEFRITMGGSVSLPCEVSGTPPPVITWLKSGTPLSPSNNLLVLPSSLELYRARPTDTGTYQCVATNLVGNVTKTFRLVVMIPPSIMPGPSSWTTQVGGQVDLPCRADGFPMPEIVWYKDGQPVNPYTNARIRQSAFGTLQILNVDQDDAGEYSCYVSNDAGKASKHVTLTVNMAPFLMDSPDSYTSLLRNPVTLQCLAAGFPPPDVEWLKDGAPLDPLDVRYYITPSNSLLIASTIREDTGVYTCNVSNVAGTQQKQMQLTVYVPPTSLTNGDTSYDVTLNNPVSLPCEVDSYPPPNITWLKDGKVIPYTNSHYVIMPLSLDIPRAVVRDSGVYTCIASNIVGNISRSYTINVHVPPHISRGPDTLTAYIGQNITLPCDSVGVPPPMVMWDKAGRRLEYNTDPRVNKLEEGSLTIANVREDDAGAYFCLVVNQAGSDFKRITLTVKDAPRIINELPDIMEKTMDTEVRIPCEVTGTPRPTVQWFKDGQPVEQLHGYTVLGDNTLLIPSLQPYDNGFYECRAQSESGTDSVHILIDTQVRPHIAGENTPDEPVVISFQEGDVVSLECNVTDSHPAATVSWFKDGAPLSAPSRSDIGIHLRSEDTTLTIPYLRAVDGGHYYCVATNIQGSSERHFSLQVHVTPVIRNVRQETITIQAGGSVTIDCEANGRPDVRILWKFGDIPISSQNSRYHVAANGSLQIREVQVIDRGVFTCIAKNMAGNDTRTVNLTVIVPPSINEGPDNIVRTLGSSVILPCETAGIPFPDITWYKDGRLLNVSQGNYEQLFSGSLRIRSVSGQDSGSYRCVAVNQAGHDYRLVTLWVHTPPALEPDAPRNASSAVNQDILLPCNIGGSPKPQYRWLKNNRELEMSYGQFELMEDGSLMIRNVEAMDRGSYTCEATNVAGVLSKDIRLEVSVAPRIPGSLTTTDYPVDVYDTIELQCRVSDAYPPPIITWFRGNERLSGQEEGVSIRNDGTTLQIGSIDIAKAGEYFCIAANEAGTDSRRWNIDVQVAPQIFIGDNQYVTTIQNKDVVLMCIAEGNPPPVITWEKENKELDLSSDHYHIRDDGALVITSPQHTDSGGYTCVATNIIDSDREDIHLQVLVPPRVSTEREVMTIRRYQSVTLQCEAIAFPAPTITWLKDGVRVSTRPGVTIRNGGGDLHLNSTREGDSGIYTCVASNDVGTQSLDILLKVQEPPVVYLRDDLQHVQVVAGGDISLDCPTTGYPKPEVNWFKNDRLLSRDEVDIDEDNTLFIPAASVEDAAKYTCLAINDAGNSSISVNVSVSVKPVIENSNIPEEVIVLLNNPVTLRCEVEVSVPQARVQWLKFGVPVREDSNVHILDSGQSLQIDQVQVSDRGRYTCIAVNIAGNATKYFGITVHVPPMFTDGNFVERSVYDIDENEFTQLSCRADGSPRPTIQWFKDGRLVTHNEPGVSVSANGQELTIQRVNRIHAGVFSCVASSIVGNITKSYTLNIRVSPEIEGAEIPHNVSVINNRAIELRCPVYAIPPPTIVWYKDGVPLHSYRNGVNISRDGTTLIITNAQLHDEGVYHCIATNEAGRQMKLFHLLIDVPPVIVSREPREIAVTAGQSATLDCESYGVPRPTVTWTKNGIFVSPASARYRMEQSGLLHIAAVSVADDGVFECFVSNSAGNVTRRIDLQVQVPPSIRPGPPKVTTRVSQSVRLFCDATGVPPPQIVWQKNGQRVQASDGFLTIRDGMLQIDDAQPSDAGRYVCIAKNGAGVDVLKIRLEVHEPPSIVTATQSYRVRVDTSVELECQVSGIPQPTIHWRHNGRDINLASGHYIKLDNNNLKIPLVRPEDSGTYTCIARNNAGIGQAERVLVVLDLPRIPPLTLEQSQMVVSVNRRAILSCPAEGYPPPEVRWRKDGRLISASGRITMTANHELIIDRVQESDSGTYTCVATNSVGSNELNFYLTVQVAPTFTNFPNDRELVAGTRLEMVCQAIGVPMPVITWLVNDTEVIPNPPTFNGRSVLAIENVRKSDSGTYMCKAENILGIRTAITAVRVRVPPRIQPTPSDTTLSLGQMAVLNCAVDGDPKPSVTWLKNNLPVALTATTRQANNGSLIISPTTISDAGYYKCQALNLYGQAEVEYHLEIQSRPTFVVEPVNVTISHGDNVLIDCVASGEPRPLMRWQKDGFRVLPAGRRTILTNNTLKIMAAQLTDSGEYMCLAENLMGRAVMSAHLIVMVHGGWSEWNEWGECSKTCGQGLRQRTRRCDSPPPANYGLQCQGDDAETTSCHRNSCPIHGRWGEWQPWEDCSVSCGYGRRVRRRQCNNPPRQYGGRDCEGEPIQVSECFSGECPVNGNWGPWSPWQQCDRTCGTGSTIRERLCNNPEPMFNGRDCVGLSRETKTCNLAQCPVDGVWGAFSMWSTCSVSCGGGQQTRTRTCVGPLYGGMPCEGSAQQTRRCNSELCPVHGGWSEWGVWSICSAICNGGTRQRFRSCTQPAPSPNGRPCLGENIDVEPCNQQPCRVDGGWSLWSPWSECSQTCGESWRHKFRACNNPAPAHGGSQCEGRVDWRQPCHVPPCIVGPRYALAMVTGNINGEALHNGILRANISVDNGGYTQVNALMENVPQDIGNVMRMLISLISPVYWTSAYERENTGNGFAVTQGTFARQTQVRFWSGEQLTMGMISQGVDEDGVLRLQIHLTGDTPEIYPEDTIITPNYRESYIQTGPGEIYGQSSRFVTIDGSRLPFAWNHTITYEETNGNMPFLVEALNAEGAYVEYNPQDNSLTYTIRVYFTRGEPRNHCPQGFQLDPTGPYCRDMNECQNSDICAHNCQNFYGGYVCTCRDGYRRNRFNERSCEDIDECLSRTGVCAANQECQNLEGGFRCVALCPRGTRRVPGTSDCGDINECQERPTVCSQQCSNTPGSYRCSCRDGYRLQGQRQCIDVNECDHRPCAPNQQCINEEGRYRCITVCPVGYERARNGSCIDINECMTNQHECSPAQTCHNRRGSYVCLCPRGLRAEGRLCTDINECLDNPCTYQCRNLRGDYECICAPGKIRLPDKKTCIGYEPPHSERTNKVECPDGMRRQGSQCIDIDECVVANQCQYQCINTEGSFYCQCPPGYVLAENGLFCEDINECVVYGIRCPPNQLCFNRQGNYSCLETSCPQYYNRDAHTGYCRKSCPSNLPSNELRRCHSLAQIIQFKTLSLLTKTQSSRDLLRLHVVREGGAMHTNTHFSIENREVPFSIRRDADGSGVLSTRLMLRHPQEYIVRVRAKSFGSNNQVELDFVYHIYISVSQFPFYA